MASFLIVAGEASGDVLGAELVTALEERESSARFFGAAGPEMQAVGVEPVVDSRSIAVMGLTEVVPRLPSLLAAMRSLVTVARDRRPSGAILIDAPDFNLRLAGRLRREGVPVVQYVGPTIWAWRPGRVKTLERQIDRLLLTLPFEPELYARSSVDAVYVGHPALDRVALRAVGRDAIAARWGLDPQRPWVALLPGSRGHELDRMGPLIGAAAARIEDRIPEVEFLTVLAPGGDPAITAEALGLPGVRMIDRDRFEVMASCRAALAMSGTVSLELALLGVPHVVAYRTSALTFAIARRLVDVEHIALPNLIAGRKVVPELIQADATPERLAAPVLAWLEDAARHEACRRGLEEVARRLGPPGVASRAANAALETFANRV